MLASHFRLPSSRRVAPTRRRPGRRAAVGLSRVLALVLVAVGSLALLAAPSQAAPVAPQPVVSGPG